MIKLTPKQTEIIERFGYESPDAFLTHYPYRYEHLFPKAIEEWQVGELVIFSGSLTSSFKTAYFGRRSKTHFSVLYDNQNVKVSLFNQPYLKAHSYTNHIVVIGTVNQDKSIVVRNISNKPLETFVGIQPVYSTKSGVSQNDIRTLIKKLLKHATIDDIVPSVYKHQYRLMNRSLALNAVHFPKDERYLEAAIRTLKYEEFLTYHLSNALNTKDLSYGISKSIDNKEIAPYLQKLPFELTSDQIIALEEIVGDLNKSSQMSRLLQGDVGSGKTIVSLLAAKLVIDKGYQVAFMVPTEILLEQHALAIKKFFPDINLVVLSSTTSNKESVLTGIKEGSIDMVLGTQALIQDAVEFKNMGLVIIDEQHRFGVGQRQTLISKGHEPDILMLSATPIPRSLASSLYFNLDVSTIQTYPSYRKETLTYYIRENSMRSILESLDQRLKEGDQVYIVCPAIVEGERKGVRNVEAIYTQTVKLFPNYKVAMIHGQMKSDERTEIMSAFSKGSVNILVTTTIIEVGIDIHNANTMVIYNAESFGIATLHQLRGRIGRGKTQGICYLLSSNENDETKTRLEAIASSNDGFKLSLQDLKLRGMGDLLGDRQSGLPHFLLGDIEKDQKIIDQAKIDAKEIVENMDKADFSNIVNIAKQKNMSYN